MLANMDRKTMLMKARIRKRKGEVKAAVEEECVEYTAANSGLPPQQLSARPALHACQPWLAHGTDRECHAVVRMPWHLASCSACQRTLAQCPALTQVLALM